MRPLRLTRSGVVGSVLVLLVAATCVRLGIWQLHRLAQRRAHNAVVAERMRQPPLRLEAVSEDTAGLAYRTVLASGTFDDDRAIVFAGRSFNGDPGVYLITPLLLDGATGAGEAGRAGGAAAAAGRGGAVLVLRGWLPSPDAATVDLARFRAGAAPVQVRGMLIPMPQASVAPSPTFRRTWYHLDGAALARQFPYRLEPLLLQAMAQPAGSATPALPRPLPPPSLDEGPHFSYAVQWFSFATIGVVGWLVILLKRGREDTAEAEQAGPGEERG